MTSPRLDGTNDTVFVQIPSYRDPELLSTLRDCVQKAERPDLLRFGIAWQRDHNDTLEEFALDPRVQIMDCHWTESQGACWARHQIHRLYQGERYALSLDSHHRFVESWDSDLKSQFEALGDSKAILTSYLPAYEPDSPIDSNPAPVILAADRFERGGSLLVVPLSVDREPRLRRAVRARFWSAHFAFSFGTIIGDVPYDPELYFLGEEISIAVRAFTHGYNLFHPDRPVAFHRYGRTGRPIHWEDLGADFGPRPGAWRLDLRSKQRLRALLGMEESAIDLGRFGLGTHRSLSDYERYAGVRFADRNLSDDAVNGLEPGDETLSECPAISTGAIS